ncbi:putative short-chain dehydrogenase [Daldinia eschscholtzii]|nr:putative short-chain dehydrogenase [Daldinia eschscholtzii]
MSVWFITGVSNGFGLLLCLKALKANHRVVGTVRSKTKSADAVKRIELAGGQVIELDLNESRENITRKVKAVGQIDYLVNNAGFLILGAVEQMSEREAHLQLQTNFFGPLYVIQAALEGMRVRRSGVIVSMSSLAAKEYVPTTGLYSASKAALEAMSESLAAEIAEFGVSVLIVEPGSFRTNFLAALNQSTMPLPEDYQGTPVTRTRDVLLTKSGKQPGDPQKGVDRIFETLTGEGLAGHLKGKILRLVLGRDALLRIRKVNDKFLEDLALAEDVTVSTDL